MTFPNLHQPFFVVFVPGNVSAPPKHLTCAILNKVLSMMYDVLYLPDQFPGPEFYDQQNLLCLLSAKASSLQDLEEPIVCKAVRFK